MAVNNRFTSGSSSEASFHNAANPPPGRRTRSISARAVGASNQWNAWATVTTSTEASGSGIALGGPLDPGDAGEHGLEPGAHRGRRFDRHHVGAEGVQLPAQLAGAGRRGRAPSCRHRCPAPRRDEPAPRRGSRDDRARSSRPSARTMRRGSRGRCSRTPDVLAVIGPTTIGGELPASTPSPGGGSSRPPCRPG